MRSPEPDRKDPRMRSPEPERKDPRMRSLEPERPSGGAGCVGVVLVSPSRGVAEAPEGLARQMAGGAVTIACAAGVGEGGAELGTDAVAIAAAIERAVGVSGAGEGGAV